MKNCVQLECGGQERMTDGYGLYSSGWPTIAWSKNDYGKKDMSRISLGSHFFSALVEGAMAGEERGLPFRPLLCEGVQSNRDE
jgi:hypothetical protein